jgi:hypothetical protein
MKTNVPIQAMTIIVVFPDHDNYSGLIQIMTTIVVL